LKAFFSKTVFFRKAFFEIPFSNPKMPNRNVTPERNPFATQRSSSRLVGSSVKYAPESASAFARRAGAGDTKENQQRLAKLARVDDAGNSARDDDKPASEVCLPFPPDRWLVGACVLCERGDAGAGRVGRFRPVRFGRVG
jgi:hypothetical protein